MAIMVFYKQRVYMDTDGLNDYNFCNNIADSIIYGKCFRYRSEEHTSELQSLRHLVCRLLLEKKNQSAAAASRFRATRRRRHAATCPGQESSLICFFLNETAPPEIYPLPLHAPFPI